MKKLKRAIGNSLEILRVDSREVRVSLAHQVRCILTLRFLVISDLFEKKDRVLVMSVFMLAIPLGSGLGFLAGGKMVELANSMGWAGGWQWSLRVTPPLAILCIILLLFVMPSNIPRGHSEGIINDEDEKSSYLEDLKYLATNKSFVAITSGTSIFKMRTTLFITVTNCGLQVLSASLSPWAVYPTGSPISWPWPMSIAAIFHHA